MQHYPHARDALQAAVPPARCPGSDLDESYTAEDVTYRSEGKARYARVSCPVCKRPPFTVKIVYTRKGVTLGPEGVVTVPRHRAAQEG